MLMPLPRPTSDIIVMESRLTSLAYYYSIAECETMNCVFVCSNSRLHIFIASHSKNKIGERKIEHTFRIHTLSHYFFCHRSFSLILQMYMVHYGSFMDMNFEFRQWIRIWMDDAGYLASIDEWWCLLLLLFLWLQRIWFRLKKNIRLCGMKPLTKIGRTNRLMNILAESWLQTPLQIRFNRIDISMSKSSVDDEAWIILVCYAMTMVMMVIMFYYRLLRDVRLL